MNILVFGPDYSSYNAASYQYEFMNTLKEEANNYYHYSGAKEIDLSLILKKLKFYPDFIFYNHGWLLDNPNINRITHSIIKNKSFAKDIKHIIFLNKEYTRLPEKLAEIKSFKFDKVFTHLHYFKSLNSSSVESKFLPLACSFRNISKFNNRKLANRKYDLFFSGILQNWNFKDLQSDLRKQIQSELFYCIFDFPLIKKIQYRDLIIYWKPFYKNRIKNILSNFFHGKRLSQKDYFEKLANSKCVLHTSSPMGIISTRVFEALGSGSIGLFSSDSEANFIFKEKFHFLSFDSIKELVDTVYSVKYSPKENFFQNISDAARKLVESEHTWKNRVSDFKEEIYVKNDKRK